MGSFWRMNKEGFAGSALPGSCAADTNPVPLPGHPMLPRVTPAGGRGDQLQAVPVEPLLACPMGGTELMTLCPPPWETGWGAEHVQGRGTCPSSGTSRDAPAVHVPQHPPNCPIRCACRQRCLRVCSVRPLHPETVSLCPSYQA